MHAGFTSLLMNCKILLSDLELKLMTSANSKTSKLNTSAMLCLVGSMISSERMLQHQSANSFGVTHQYAPNTLARMRPRVRAATSAPPIMLERASVLLPPSTSPPPRPAWQVELRQAALLQTCLGKLGEHDFYRAHVDRKFAACIQCRCGCIPWDTELHQSAHTQRQ